MLSSSERGQRLFFALLSTVIILLFVKIPIEKFKVENETKVIPEHKEYFSFAGDYDNDGNSEFYFCRNDVNSNRFTLNVFDYNNMLIETTNMVNQEWTNDLHPVLYDIDRNGINEFLLISVSNDTVYLNAIDLTRFKPFFEPVLIGEIERKVAQKSYRAQFIFCGDKDHDGQNEIYFFFDSGFGLYPRGIFRFDYHNKKIYNTPKSYISWMIPEFSDINADGMEELLGTDYAPNNVPFEAQYSDDRSYIGAFNLNLEYLFPPIPMRKGYGSVTTQSSVFSDTVFFALNTNLSAKSDSLYIFILSYHGKIIRKKGICTKEESIQNCFLKVVDKKNYLFIKGYEKILLTAGLENVPDQLENKTGNKKDDYFYKSWDIDADNDGTAEKVIFINDNSTFKIINLKRKGLTYFSTETRETVLNIYPFFVDHKVVKILVTTLNGYFFIRYKENSLYWLKYLIWLGIFLTTLLITYLIQFTQRRRMEQKWETEKQMIELQFNTIRNQLNPHFIFNALNSVGFLIENGKKEEAYDYLSINARIIRKVLEDAEMTTRTLDEEIKFVKDYLTVQEFRFKDRFRTVFSIDENVNLSIAVPKMVLHSYVENSVKHGFKNTYSGGLLEISVSAIPKGVMLMVSDNGNFSKEDDHQEKNTGKGLGIMESYYRLFEKLHNCKIQTTFTGLNEAGNAQTGSKVIISIIYN